MGKKKKQKTTQTQNEQVQQQQQATSAFDQSGDSNEWANALSNLFTSSNERGGFDSTNFLNALQQMSQQQSQQQQSSGSTNSNTAFARNDAQSMEQRRAEEMAQRQAMETAQRQSTEDQRRQAEEFARREAQETAQTQTSGIDADSQAYVNMMRMNALNSMSGLDPSNFAPSTGMVNQTADELMNPHVGRVLDGVGQTYDRLRDKSKMDTAQGATLAGAYGGSRHGVAEATRAAELDRAEGEQAGRILSDSYESARSMAAPLAAQQAMAPFQFANAQNELLRGALGPTGTTSTGRGTQMGSSTGSSMGTSAGSSVGSSAGSQMGSTTGSTTGSTSGSTRGTSSGTESTSAFQQQMSNLMGLLSGTTSNAQTGGQAGNQWGQTSGTQNGLLSSSGRKAFNQAGNSNSSSNSNSNSSMTGSTTSEASNPWYQDVMGAASIFGGLGGFGGLGRLMGGGGGALASRMPTDVSNIYRAAPSPTSGLRVRGRGR